MEDRDNNDEYNRYGCRSIREIGYRDTRTGKIILYDKPIYPGDERPSHTDEKNL